MCRRFVQRYTWDDIQDLYDLPDGPAHNLPAHYNIASTDPVEVVRSAANGVTELVSMRWGLVHEWKKPLKQLPANFNARAETVSDKPMFRDAFPTPSVHHSGQWAEINKDRGSDWLFNRFEHAESQPSAVNVAEFADTCIVQKDTPHLFDDHFIAFRHDTAVTNNCGGEFLDLLVIVGFHQGH